jgi:hypothetical protein
MFRIGIALGLSVSVAGVGCQSAADACASAGGRCVTGGIHNCAKRGDSCESNPPTPAGRFCCLAFADERDAMAQATEGGGAADGGCSAADATTDSCAPQMADAGGVCTPGQDWTCNDDPAISSIHGQCLPDHTCTCSMGSGLNPATGKCR